MRQLLGRLLRLCLWPVGTILLYLVFALAGAVIPGSVNRAISQPANDTPVTIGLIAGDIHYDFLIPLTDATRATFGFAQQDGVPVLHPEARWMIIGWGAHGFYTTAGRYRDVTAKAVWRAITGDSAVLRLDVTGDFDPAAQGVQTLNLTDAQFAALVSSIADSISRASNGKPIAIDHPGFTPTDRFYAARGRFHLGQTCNVWLGNQLRAAGLAFGAWTPTPMAVALSLWWFQPSAAGTLRKS